MYAWSQMHPYSSLDSTINFSYFLNTNEYIASVCPGIIPACLLGGRFYYQRCAL